MLASAVIPQLDPLSPVTSFAKSTAMPAAISTPFLNVREIPALALLAKPLLRLLPSCELSKVLFSIPVKVFWKEWSSKSRRRATWKSCSFWLCSSGILASATASWLLSSDSIEESSFAPLLISLSAWPICSDASAFPLSNSFLPFSSSSFASFSSFFASVIFYSPSLNLSSTAFFTVPFSLTIFFSSRITET